MIVVNSFIFHITCYHHCCHYDHLQHPYADDDDQFLGRHDQIHKYTNTQIQFATDQFLGRHDTWGSSPQAFSAPQGAEGNTAKPVNMMTMTLVKMITVSMQIMVVIHFHTFSPGSHTQRIGSAGICENQH